MSFYSRKSFSLIELVMAISLLGVIILAVSNIDIFSRYHYAATDRRAKLQNDVSLCLEHIAKNASRAIGNETFFGANSVVSMGVNTLSIFIDANKNGSIDAGMDYWVRYKLEPSSHEFSYCGQCSDSACGSCSAISEEQLARDVTEFIPAKDFSQAGYIDVSITACWDPRTPSTCGTPDNPSVSMSTGIALPSVAIK